MIGDCEKLSVLMMFRGLLTYQKYTCWNNCGPSLKSDVSEDLPAGSLEQKNIHCVSFDDVLRSLLEKDLSELLKGHLTYHCILF